MTMSTFVLALLAVASAQLKDGPGSGVAKSTYAATDPIAGFDWMVRAALRARPRSCGRAVRPYPPVVKLPPAGSYMLSPRDPESQPQG